MNNEQNTISQENIQRPKKILDSSVSIFLGESYKNVVENKKDIEHVLFESLNNSSNSTNINDRVSFDTFLSENILYFTKEYVKEINGIITDDKINFFILFILDNELFKDYINNFYSVENKEDLIQGEKEKINNIITKKQ